MVRLPSRADPNTRFQVKSTFSHNLTARRLRGIHPLRQAREYVRKDIRQADLSNRQRVIPKGPGRARRRALPQCAGRLPHESARCTYTHGRRDCRREAQAPHIYDGEQKYDRFNTHQPVPTDTEHQFWGANDVPREEDQFR